MKLRVLPTVLQMPAFQMLHGVAIEFVPILLGALFKEIGTPNMPALVRRFSFCFCSLVFTGVRDVLVALIFPFISSRRSQLFVCCLVFRAS